MKLRELHFFIEVVNCNGFGKATEKLHVTQPAISRAIKQLEDELGGALIFRDPKGVRMTERGEILFRYAKNIIQQEKNLQQELMVLDNNVVEVLRVGLPPIISAAYFPKVIFEFRSHYPLVDLNIVEISTTELETSLQEETIDIAVGILPVDPGNCKIQRFAVDRLLLVVPRGHALAGQDIVSLNDVLREQMVLFSEPFKINSIIYSAFGTHGLTPDVVGRSNNLELLTAMVRSGMGISLLPRSIWRSAMDPELVAIPFADPCFDYEIALIRRSGNFISRSCRAWADITQQVMGFDIEPDFWG